VLAFGVGLDVALSSGWLRFRCCCWYRQLISLFAAVKTGLSLRSRSVSTVSVLAGELKLLSVRAAPPFCFSRSAIARTTTYPNDALRVRTL
jgi:hypothetical protein